MTAYTSLDYKNIKPATIWAQAHCHPLMHGEILVTQRPHQNWGGAAATAQMYLPLSRQTCWQHLTDYPRWVQYCPDLTRSEILAPPTPSKPGCKRLYQVGSKNFILFSTQVEIYLQVFEISQQQIQFRLEKGSFVDFSADLLLQDHRDGTLLSYSVAATPNFPIPGMFIQQALQLELPANLRQMRQVLLDAESASFQV
ncbi:MAG: cyclase [Desertifilum sp.]|nr:cyclase [Desertifilum sp.]